jgi:hypothetical protein
MKFSSYKALWQAHLDGEKSKPRAVDLYPRVQSITGPYVAEPTLGATMEAAHDVFFMAFGPMGTMELLHHTKYDRRMKAINNNATGHIWCLAGLEAPAPVMMIDYHYFKKGTAKFITCPDYETLRQATTPKMFRAIPAPDQQPEPVRTKEESSDAYHLPEPPVYGFRSFTSGPALLAGVFADCDDRSPAGLAITLMSRIGDMEQHHAEKEGMDDNFTRTHLGYLVKFLWACEAKLISSMSLYPSTSPAVTTWARKVEEDILTAVGTASTTPPPGAATLATTESDSMNAWASATASLAEILTAKLGTIAPTRPSATETTKPKSSFDSWHSGMQRAFLMLSETDESGVRRTAPLIAIQKLFEEKSPTTAYQLALQMLRSATKDRLDLSRGSVVALQHGQFLPKDSGKGLHPLSSMAFGFQASGLPDTSSDDMDRQLLLAGDRFDSVHLTEMASVSYMVPTTIDQLTTIVWNYDAFLTQVFGKKSPLRESGTLVLKTLISEYQVKLRHHQADDPTFFAQILTGFDNAVTSVITDSCADLEVPLDAADVLDLDAFTNYLRQALRGIGDFAIRLPADVKAVLTVKDESKKRGRDTATAPPATKFTKVFNASVNKQLQQASNRGGGFAKIMTQSFESDDALAMPDGSVICLKYHCQGSCRSDCTRKATHKELPPAIRTKFHSWAMRIVKPDGAAL